ncbi:Jag N-terminal domain-containing protein [Sulfurimonas paralvinellae]|uniref:Protein jag n=1 Tax=Sulfurimonas paralvinellae TaxID=317658 RepID=A0A7M1B946_9BACT|nr:Jag N-terminal domain-containing protein [Sulfurimonas paralvinellae]QOP46230.1 protein jag [Sulfurimonas paralvinellae]
MIKIEAVTLEEAYKDAAATLKCSVTEMAVEVVQAPSGGFLGLFKKPAIIVATIDKSKQVKNEVNTPKQVSPKKEKPVVREEEISPTFLNDTIMPTSFVSDQDEEELEEDLASGLDYTADYDDAYDEENIEKEVSVDIDAIAVEVQKEINDLFKLICFEIDTIEVSPYDNETLLVEFKGEDAALLIGKEGYRYKALSYMLFNWINTKYDVQLRLEIAEFLKNQEESVGRYLTSVCENIDRDGRAQTKILDGVLVQIALKELRERYPEKYVVIRSTRDGLKYILVNDYHTN